MTRDTFIVDAQAAGIDAEAAGALFDRLYTAPEVDAVAQIWSHEFLMHAQAVGIEASEATELYERLQMRRRRIDQPLRRGRIDQPQRRAREQPHRLSLGIAAAVCAGIAIAACVVSLNQLQGSVEDCDWGSPVGSLDSAHAFKAGTGPDWTLFLTSTVLFAAAVVILLPGIVLRVVLAVPLLLVSLLFVLLAHAMVNPCSVQNEPPEDHVLVTMSPVNSGLIVTGDGQAFYRVPASANGLDLTEARALVTTPSRAGQITVQVRNVTKAVDMLSTTITIDPHEQSSKTGTDGVPSDTNARVATGNKLAIDVDAAGAGAKGLTVVLTLSIPPWSPFSTRMIRPIVDETTGRLQARETRAARALSTSRHGAEA
jgi:hypothetical protein